MDTEAGDRKAESGDEGVSPPLMTVVDLHRRLNDVLDAADAHGAVVVTRFGSKRWTITPYREPAAA